MNNRKPNDSVSVWAARARQCLAALVLCLSPAVYAQTVTVTADEWARPRSGERLRSLPALRSLVAAYDRQSDARIVIRYAGGEEGSLWAEEMRSWLAALGIPSKYVVLRSGLQRNDLITLTLQAGGGQP